MNVAKELEEDGVLVSYRGFISDSVTCELSRLLDAALAEYGWDELVKAKVRAMFIEQVQNIQRYSAIHRKGYVIVANEGGHFSIETMNPIDAEAKDFIVKRLEKIIGKPPEELRKMYREELRSGGREDKRGAGLGLLYLAKTTAQQLSFAFETSADERLLFRIRTYV